MEQLLSMGFTQELASQALAATGGKSTLKATEWLLSQRAEAAAAAAAAAATASTERPSSSKQQARVDRFFPPPPRALHTQQTRYLPDASFPDDSISCRDGEENKVRPLDSHPSLLFPECRDTHKAPLDAPNPVKPYTLPSSSPSEPPTKRKHAEDETDPHHKSGASATLKVSSLPPPLRSSSKVPLAERMRPSSVDEIVGQDHLLGVGCILRSLVENDTMASVIFWGPPGTGKTSLAKAIARSISCRFVTASAVTSGVKEVREILEEAKRLKKSGHRTLFFMDEVHRFNKAQQDAFLPSIEAGHVIFIGATTENPSFEVNAALLSRCKVLTLNKLQPESIKQLLERALLSTDKGVAAPYVDHPMVQKIEAEEEALHLLSEAADGDARVALNALEIAVASAVTKGRSQNKPAQEGVPQPLLASGVHDSRADDVNPSTLERSRSGNARAALNALEIAAASAVTKGRPQSKPAQEGSFQPLLASGANDSRADDVSPSTLERSRSGNALSMKRELPLKLSALKESLDPSQEEYTRPFKRFVGGKEVKPLSFSTKERETQASDTQALPTDDPIDANSAPKHPDSAEGSAPNTTVLVRLEDISEALQRSHFLYDKKGEEHYNIISALHKSMRGGDPDAGLYWLARMLEGGEGPLYVARRLVRFASEDVGLADPQALTLAVACYQACHFLGMPECNVHLAQCVAYLALAPKSVAVYQAIEASQQLVRNRGNDPVPLHLRNAPTGLMKQLGYGKGYVYPPNHEGLIEQEYLPPSLRGYKFLKWP